MKIKFSVRACGLRLSCRNKQALLLISLALLSMLSFTQKAASLTLKEGLEAARENSINLDILRERSQGIQLKKEALDESRVKHSISGRTGYSKNEIGDSQDLSASATESTLYSISYQQRFENGFNWTVSHATRSAKALTDNEEDEEYSKQMLIARLPLMGKSAEIDRLNSNKRLLAVEADEQVLAQDEANLQVEVARAFFTAYREEEAYRVSLQKMNLHEGRTRLLKANPKQFTEFEHQKSLIEFEKEQIYLQQQKSIRDESYRQLEFLVGTPVSDHLIVPESIPDRDWNEEMLLPLYLSHSAKLSRLNNRLKVLQQDAAIVDLDDIPEVTIGGLMGNTNLNNVKGSNLGVNLTVTYNFGGGEAKAVSAIQRELASMNLELELEKRNVRLEMKKDLSQLQTFIKQLKLSRLEYNLLEKQIELKRKEFQIGQIGREKLIEQELALHDLYLDIVEQHVDGWFQFLTIFEVTRHSLTDYL